MTHDPLQAFGSQLTDAARVPWIPLGDGEAFKPLAFLPNQRGRILLLRLDPGILVPRHRHTGEVHGFNLEGQRKLLDNDQLVGPGDYVYEPAGNVDSWMAVGDTVLTVFIVVRGAVEYLDDADKVIQRDTTATMAETYRRYCDANGLEPLDLTR
jgi:quercetin dioxygenase-like cupin family protein